MSKKIDHALAKTMRQVNLAKRSAKRLYEAKMPAEEEHTEYLQKLREAVVAVDKYLKKATPPESLRRALQGFYDHYLGIIADPNPPLETTIGNCGKNCFKWSYDPSHIYLVYAGSLQDEEPETVIESSVGTFYLQNLANPIAAIQNDGFAIAETLTKICKDSDTCIELDIDCANGVGGLIPSSAYDTLSALYLQYIDHITTAVQDISVFHAKWESHLNASRISYSICFSCLHQKLQNLSSPLKAFGAYYKKYDSNFASAVQKKSTFCAVHEQIISDLNLDYNEETRKWTYTNMKNSVWSHVCELWNAMIECEVIGPGVAEELIETLGDSWPPCPYAEGCSYDE